jgi:hypothetical protein
MVRSLRRADADAWKAMRLRLWPDTPHAANDAECGAVLAGTDPDVAVFVDENAGALTGFVEISLRKHADGRDSSPG